MEFILLDEYLQQHGVTSDTPQEEILKLKKQHRKEYHKAYYQQKGKELEQQKRKRKKEYYLRLTLEEDRALHKALEAYGKDEDGANERSISQMIKAMALSYLDRKYIIHSPDQIADLMLQIRKIGTNINQMCVLAYRQKNTGAANRYEQILERVYALEEMVMRHLSEPPEGIKNFVSNASPDQIRLLEQLIDQRKWQEDDH